MLGPHRQTGHCVVAVLLALSLASAAPAGAQNRPLCRGEAATIVGTPGDDTLYGTAGDDVIVGLGGNDVIYGDSGLNATGNDIICAGPGNDVVFGGGGGDTIDGQAGHDELHGEVGADTIVGGPGNDHIRGDELLNNNQYSGPTVPPGFADRLRGGPGDDELYGGAGADVITGNGGDDFIVGEEGFDRLFGGKGDDSISGLGGPDRLHGGPGTDLLVGGGGRDRLNGGPGRDSCQKSRNDSAKRCGYKWDFEYRTVTFETKGYSTDGYVNVTFDDALATVTVDGLNGLPVASRYLTAAKEFTWRLPARWALVEVERTFQSRNATAFGYGAVVIPSNETGPFRLVLECCAYQPRPPSSFEARVEAASTTPVLVDDETDT